MKTTKRMDYVSPESEFFEMKAEAIICVSGGNSEGSGEGEIPLP